MSPSYMTVDLNMGTDAKSLDTGRVDSCRPIYARNRFLPFEIVSLIASYMYASHPALHACALTCRLWKDAIYPHRFCQVVVTRESQLVDLLKFIETDKVKSVWVQEIVSTVPPQRMLLKMINLAPHLPRVHTLEFRGLQRDAGADCAAVRKVFSQFISVETLRFRRSQLSLSVVQAAACALPKLTCLEFEQGGFNNDDDDHPFMSSSQRDRIRLKSLRVEKTQQCANFYGWISSSDSQSTIQSFDVDGVDSGERLLESAGFIQALGSSLTHLGLLARRPRIDYFREATYKATLKAINLESNSNIRSLEFYDPLHPGIISWLGQLPRPALLRSVVLHMPARDVSTSYAELDKYLTRPEFCNLKEVHIVYLRALRAVDSMQIRQDLEAGFPAMAGRGLLKLTISRV
ncbi:hypothetical protein QCA50_014826 [Cerrena zonata]|uniref:F-box domain-containing protein n=1 Tax=Cerrena zonata TaxID=2478898 RepID=A0AAW0FVD8_9APHY